MAASLKSRRMEWKSETRKDSMAMVKWVVSSGVLLLQQ